MCRCNDDGIPELMKGCGSGVALINSDCSITLRSKDTRMWVSN